MIKTRHGRPDLGKPLLGAVLVGAWAVVAPLQVVIKRNVTRQASSPPLPRPSPPLELVKGEPPEAGEIVAKLLHSSFQTQRPYPPSSTPEPPHPRSHPKDLSSPQRDSRLVPSRHCTGRPPIHPNQPPPPSTPSNPAYTHPQRSSKV